MHTDADQVATIIRIERSAIHDGQGLRTVLFLKGCPLKCAWCSTPESQAPDPERGYLRHRCTLCGRCVEFCPAKALFVAAKHPAIGIDGRRCQKCFRCASICPNRAIKWYGYKITAAEALREIVKDEIFYFHSGGGVTLSGGEPLSRPGFAQAVLKGCKKLGIHTAVESCLHLDFADIEAVLPWLDILYADIKHMDNRRHTRWTGAGNELILDNIVKIEQSAFPLEIVVRIPLIPGINDTEKNLLATMEFCMKLTKIKGIELLPYHRLGSDTYHHMGREYCCRRLNPLSADELFKKAVYLRGLRPGFPVKIGSGFS